MEPDGRWTIKARDERISTIVEVRGQPRSGGVMRRVNTALLSVIAVVACAGLQACNKNQPGPSSEPIESGRLSNGPHALPDPAASPPDDGNWVMPGKDYGSTRFSGLNQITPANVGKLAPQFTFSTATTHGYEAPPLVVKGTMYLITPYPNDLYALDLTKPGAPQ